MNRDSKGTPVYAYRKGPPRGIRKNPERTFQKSVVQLLEMCAPDDIEWGSTLNGAHLSQSQRSIAKATGLRPGALDMFFIVRQRTYWLELKSDVGVLTRDQKRFISRLHPDCWAVARTLDEVIAWLTKIGVQLRLHRLST